MSFTAQALLPPEIIDEILRSDELDKDDLTQCCRVNKTWLASARESLYNTLTISLTPCSLPQNVEAYTDDLAALVQSYYLAQTSFLLFSTLLNNRRFGLLVRTIRYRSGYPGEGPSAEDVIWMQPPDVVTTFARLCPRATGFFFTLPFCFTGNCREAVRVHCKNLERLNIFGAVQGDWDELRHYQKLVSFTTYWNDLPGPPFQLPPLGLSMVHFCVESTCSPADVKAIPPSTWQSLRHLHVPVNMVSEIRSNRFPQLQRLTLKSARYLVTPLTPDVTRTFLRSLRTFDVLRIFEVDEDAHKILDPDCNLLRKSLPVDCRRVTFNFTPPFNALLDVIQRTAKRHRILELGLDEETRDAANEAGRHYLAAARAAAEAARVEIIWVS